MALPTFPQGLQRIRYQRATTLGSEQLIIVNVASGFSFQCESLVFTIGMGSQAAALDFTARINEPMAGRTIWNCRFFSTTNLPLNIFPTRVPLFDFAAPGIEVTFSMSAASTAAGSFDLLLFFYQQQTA